MPEVSFTLSDGELQRLAVLVADLLLERGLTGAPAPAEDGWLDVGAAAEYISAKRKRVYDLVSQGRLEPARDGSRLLFRRSWLAAYLDGQAAGTCTLARCLAIAAPCP